MNGIDMIGKPAPIKIPYMIDDLVEGRGGVPENAKVNPKLLGRRKVLPRPI